MTLPSIPGVAYGYANYGRWVVSCPTPYCRDALTLPPGSGFLCPACSVRADVVWPNPQTVELIEHILLMRPDVATRNWLPGETPVDLLAENLAHGLSPVVHPEVGASASRLVLDASGDGLIRVHLLDEVAVIDSADLLAIGG